METGVDLTAAAEALTEYWSPRVVGRVNDQYVKVAKLKGRLAWHAHEMEDELFLVLDGVLVLEFEDRAPVTLKTGQMYVVPRESGTTRSPRRSAWWLWWRRSPRCTRAMFGYP